MISITKRKKIKFFIQKHFLPKLSSNIISPSTPKNIGTAIINLSVIPWDYRYQRPQQLATEISKIIPVFYVHNEFSLTNNTDQIPFILSSISSNLYSLKLSSSNNYFIYQKLPDHKDIEIISNSIKNLISTLNISHPIIKIDHPFWTPIAAELKLPIIYDCLDNQDNFELNSKSVIEEEKSLFKIASKIIATSQFLYDKASKYKSKEDIFIISNGTNFEHFTNNITISTENDLSKFPQPIYGYFGAIDNWLDTEFIEKLAKSTHGSIVLIGQNNLGNKIRSPNVYFLGEKDYQSLPQYLKQFDVCLIPFKLNSLTKAVNPVKIFEYFSQGKAVISSTLPELKKYSQLLYFYDSETDISKLISKINTEDQTLKQERLLVAQNNTWKSKADTIISIIEKL